MKFIDLFSGLGGFHVALDRLGCECVFASEKKESLRNLYAKNFGIIPNSDISKIDIRDIPQHDVLCAGFPCQPFSKAGSQFGFEDKKNGYLFDIIVEIIEYHKPKYFILENVRNLEKHERGETLKYMIKKLNHVLNYDLDYKILSPHNFGIPQHRERFFMVGSRDGLGNFEWPKTKYRKTSVFDVLIENDKKAIPLEDEKVYVLELWQEFLSRIPKSVSLPGPLWSMEFGATYPYQSATPHSTSNYTLGRSHGSFGIPLKGMNRESKFSNLPSYARVSAGTFPKWKENFIQKNRMFYEDHGHLFDDLVCDIRDLGVQSWQKIEWNAKGNDRLIKNHLIQFRGSGIRFKRTDYFPSLVTVSTQIPILGWENRYITISEGARLQNLHKIEMPNNVATAFGALGNAVNAKIVYKVAKRLFQSDPEKHNNRQLELLLSA